LDGFTQESLVSYLLRTSGKGIGGYVVTPNLEHLHGMAHDSVLMSRALAADLRVADGMPLVWASRLQGTPLPGRVAGSDLVDSLASALAEGKRTLFLLGGDPGVAERAAGILRRRYPGLSIVGTHSPPFGYETDPDALAKIRATLLGASPDFVYIALPFAKASSLAIGLRESLPRTWFLGVGISLSFICGDVARAPEWLQVLGLEWAHRLIQEPRRLAKRYLVDGIPFAGVLFLSAVSCRFRTKLFNRVLWPD
jgi:N-acetylglucosaminyldiphosphoundecaprenol N-acetyl-beta-D-mannosaminyltransferase